MRLIASIQKLVCSQLLIALLAGNVSLAQETLHKGKPVRTWLAELLDDKPENREIAEREFKAMETNALPAMLHFVTLDDPWDNTRNDSIVFNTFGRLGQKARPAIPRLTTLANDTNYCSNAAMALQLIGVDAALSLANVLTNQDPKIRTIVLQTLRHYSGNSNAVFILQKAVPSIQECVKAKEPMVSVEAMSTLMALCPDSGLVVRTIRPMLRAENSHVRLVAAGSLRLYGSQAKDAVDDLIKALSDADKTMRETAARSIREIDPDRAKTLGLKFPVFE